MVYQELPQDLLESPQVTVVRVYSLQSGSFTTLLRLSISCAAVQTTVRNLCADFKTAPLRGILAAAIYNHTAHCTNRATGPRSARIK